MWNAAVSGKRIAQRSLLRAAPLFTEFCHYARCSAGLRDACKLGRDGRALAPRFLPDFRAAVDLIRDADQCAWAGVGTSTTTPSPLELTTPSKT